MEKARPYILFSCLVAMVFGLLFSRALLSVSMAAFIGVSLLHSAIRAHLNCFIKQPLYIGTSLLFLVPLISGLWSHDQTQWMDMMQVKLPLLLMPIAFAWPMGLSAKHWRFLIGSFLILLFITAGWSLVDYFSYKTFYDGLYLQGGGIRTALDDDHVRFSLLVFFAIVFSIRLFYEEKGKWFSWIWVILLCFFIVYLHILAARTGLLAFYFSLLLSAIYLLLRSKRSWGLALIILLLAIPSSCWFLFPSFKNKLKLFRYEISYFGNGSYVPYSNDMVRGISLRAGWAIIGSQPFSGAGYGDILASSKSWYLEHYPQMREDDKIYPSSQYLMYGAGTGLIGLFIFCCLMLLPFFTGKDMDRLPWILVAAGLGLSYLFDIGLEVQFGVFIHCFFLFTSFEWMKRQNTTSL